MRQIFHSGMNERNRNRLKIIFSVAKEFVPYTILVFALWCMTQHIPSPEHTVDLLAFLVGFWLTWRFKSFLTPILHGSFAVYLILGAAWYIDFLFICLSMGYSFSEYVAFILH